MHSKRVAGLIKWAGFCTLAGPMLVLAVLSLTGQVRVIGVVPYLLTGTALAWFYGIEQLHLRAARNKRRALSRQARQQEAAAERRHAAPQAPQDAPHRHVPARRAA